jgi:drug/metabolite transporter (DMT)-like permease
MVATLFGPIVYVVILVVLDYFLGATIGSWGFIIALLLAFIGWIWVYKASFDTGWLGGLGIAVLAIVIFAVASVILGALFGIVVPASLFPRL